MQIHLIDGTYELFRHFYAQPSARDDQGREVGAVRGVLRTVLAMISNGATHVGVATDHVIESFRNDLWPGYKTGAGIDPALWSQFPLLEETLQALGVRVWPMVEFEADDALAAAAAFCDASPDVERVLIWTPDKDLAQAVRGSRVVQMIRKGNETRDAAGVMAKFGVPPESIPDYLALVGDTSDGYPGLAGWGAKSTAAVLARYRHIEQIPDDWTTWGVNASGAARLSKVLKEQKDDALLFRTLATLRTDVPVLSSVDELRWAGPTEAFAPIAALLDAAKTDDFAKPRPAR